jgi:uncharacterized protein
MPPLSMLIKAASSNCNLKCKYCFYHSLAKNRRIKSYGLMTPATLEIIVEKALDYADDVCTFGFQGGEPTLIGLNFFQKLIELQKIYNYKRVKIFNAIQTNGTKIDQSWAKFLVQNNFLVGISLDGFKELHNSNRIDAKDNGTFTGVMNAIRLFNQYQVEYNILSVVTSEMAGDPERIYDFAKKNNFRYLQYIPCLDPLDEEPGGSAYSLKPDQYACFLKSLFDLWYQDILNGNLISIRYFMDLVELEMGLKPGTCGMVGECNCQYVIEADGGVYPCDFYVIDPCYLGNITKTGFRELMNSKVCQDFIKVSTHLDPKCRKCKSFHLCRGGCRRTREPFRDGKPDLDYFCSSYLEFFGYTSQRIHQLATNIIPQLTGVSPRSPVRQKKGPKICI